MGRAAHRAAALPHEIDLPATDDEVRMLLNRFGLSTAAGHLDQAVQTHTRGEWAAASAQLRTFMESLFDDIALHIDATAAERAQRAENRRGLLASDQIEFCPRVAGSGRPTARTSSTGS